MTFIVLTFIGGVVCFLSAVALSFVYQLLAGDNQYVKLSARIVYKTVRLFALGSCILLALSTIFR